MLERLKVVHFKNYTDEKKIISFRGINTKLKKFYTNQKHVIFELLNDFFINYLFQHCKFI